MSSPLTRVVLIGASGRLGPHILSAISADPSFTVSVVSRASSTAKYSDGTKVHTVADSFPVAELAEAFRGADAVISISNAGADPSSQKALIDAAVQAGVKRFIPSAFGSDTRNDAGVAVLPQFWEGKRVTEAYLKTKEKEGLTWSTFITGPFFERSMTLGYLGFDISNRKALILNDGNIAWDTTKIADIGLAVKNALLSPEKTTNKYVLINSFHVTQNQLLASFEKATGSKWEVTKVDAEAERKKGEEAMAAGDFMAGAGTLLRYIECGRPDLGGNYTDKGETANELLELPKRDLDTTIAALVKG